MHEIVHDDVAQNVAQAALEQCAAIKGKTIQNAGSEAEGGGLLRTGKDVFQVIVSESIPSAGGDTECVIVRVKKGKPESLRLLLRRKGEPESNNADDLSERQMDWLCRE